MPEVLDTARGRSLRTVLGGEYTVCPDTNWPRLEKNTFIFPYKRRQTSNHDKFFNKQTIYREKIAEERKIAKQIKERLHWNILNYLITDEADFKGFQWNFETFPINMLQSATF